jgi:hypothetical protein
VESIDSLIQTLEILSSALSARDKDKAFEAIKLLLQQFTATFGHATHIFLAILFLETLKVHILSEEFEEASGGALALLARLRAVNTAIKQSAAQSASTNSDALAEDVFDDVMNAEIKPRSALLPPRGGKREAGAAGSGAPEPGNPFAAYPHIRFIQRGPEPRLLASVGGFPSVIVYADQPRSVPGGAVAMSRRVATRFIS